jgi:histidine triad (HIT) family protein
MKPELASKMNELAQTIGNAMLIALHADGMNASFNIKHAGGQEIMHTHMHLVPRFKDDGLKLFPLKDMSEEDRILFASKIIKEL